MWTDKDQSQVDSIIAQHDIAEIIAAAIGRIVEARIVLADSGKNWMPLEASKSLNFNERLLVAAIDELIANSKKSVIPF